MTSQIFKKNVPNEMIFNLLDSICLKNTKYYIFNLNSYKQGIFKESIPQFITECNKSGSSIYYYIYNFCFIIITQL